MSPASPICFVAPSACSLINIFSFSLLWKFPEMIYSSMISLWNFWPLYAYSSLCFSKSWNFTWISEDKGSPWVERFWILNQKSPSTSFGVFRQEKSSVFPPLGPERGHQWRWPVEDSCSQQDDCLIESWATKAVRQQRGLSIRPWEMIVSQLSESVIGLQSSQKLLGATLKRGVNL